MMAWGLLDARALQATMAGLIFRNAVFAGRCRAAIPGPSKVRLACHRTRARKGSGSSASGVCHQNKHSHKRKAIAGSGVEKRGACMAREPEAQALTTMIARVGARRDLLGHRDVCQGDVCQGDVCQGDAIGNPISLNFLRVTARRDQARALDQSVASAGALCAALAPSLDVLAAAFANNIKRRLSRTKPLRRVHHAHGLKKPM
jgi:hypothetical protein